MGIEPLRTMASAEEDIYARAAFLICRHDAIYYYNTATYIWLLPRSAWRAFDVDGYAARQAIIS